MSTSGRLMTLKYNKPHTITVWLVRMIFFCVSSELIETNFQDGSHDVKAISSIMLFSIPYFLNTASAAAEARAGGHTSKARLVEKAV